MLKTGVKTVEFWATLAAIGVKVFWKDFPDDAFFAILAWVGGRSAQKFFGLADPTGKPSWQTSEFWVSAGYALVTTIFPDFPKDSLDAVLIYVGGRTGLKMKAGYDAKKAAAVSSSVPPTAPPTTP